MSGEEDKIQKFLSIGGESVGGVSGAVIGLIMGGPAGAIAGAAVGPVVKELICDFADRALSKGEKVKISGVLLLSLNKIEEYLKAGRKPRNDDFFEQKAGKGSKAAEILEGVLLKAKNEHQMKKMKLIANIFANAAFIDGISEAEINHLLALVESLTYRKLCCLALISRNVRRTDNPNFRVGLPLRPMNYLGSAEENLPKEVDSILQELYELHNQGLIRCLDAPPNTWGSLEKQKDVIDPSIHKYYVKPSGMVLTNMGEKYCEVIGVQDIPDDDIEEVSQYLRIGELPRLERVNKSANERSI